jgi:hypothetical protein
VVPAGFAGYFTAAAAGAGGLGDAVAVPVAFFRWHG